MSAFRTIKVSQSRFEHAGLRHVTVKSRALGRRVDLTLFVPSGFEDGAGLPLVTLLHGVYSSHWAWAYNAGAHLTAARMIAEGEIPPLVLAMPSDGLWGDGSGYVVHEEADYESWIVQEVPLVIEEAAAAFSLRSPRFLAGLSMGGYGTLRLGAKYGSVYQAISAHSSITSLSELEEFVEQLPDLAGREGAGHSVLQAILNNRQNLPAIRFDCGVDDPLLNANRLLHEGLSEAGIEHRYEEFPGGHEWSYWEEHLVDTLRFFGAHL